MYLIFQLPFQCFPGLSWFRYASFNVHLLIYKKIYKIRLTKHEYLIKEHIVEVELLNLRAPDKTYNTWVIYIRYI